MSGAMSEPVTEGVHCALGLIFRIL